MSRSQEIDADLMFEMLEWSPAQEFTVKGRPMTLRLAEEIPHDFWTLWREHKDAIKALGISVGKDDNDEFRAKWWQEVDEDKVDGSGPIPELPTQSLSVRPMTRDLDCCVGLLRDFQVPAVGSLVQSLTEWPFAIDASETGLGKTYTALGVAANLGWNFGILCPASVVTKWTNTCIDVFGMEPEFVLSYEKLRGKENDFVTKHSKISRGKPTTKFTWNTVGRVLLIMDEIHMCSGLGSLNSELLLGAILDPNIWILGLSATVANSPLSMRYLGLGLGLHRGNDWWDWCLRMGCRPGVFGGLGFVAKPGSIGERSLKAIHQSVFPRRGVRLRRRELGSSLPTNLIEVEVVDIDESSPPKDVREALAAVDAAEADDISKAREEERDVAGFTVTMRERQRSEILKVVEMFSKALDLSDEGWSVIMFLNFQRSIDLVERWLNERKIHYRKMVGGAKRDQQLADFQANKVRWFVTQVDAGSAAIDLHDLDGRYRRASLFSPGYSPVKLIQGLGRTDRDGRKSECLQILFFSTAPIEVRAAKLVQAKLNNLELLNEGDLAGVLKITS